MIVSSSENTCQPRTRRRPERHHLPDPEQQRGSAPAPGPRLPRTHLATASPAAVPAPVGAETHRIGRELVSDLLDKALARTGLADQADGTPLHYTPHDFRRIFITDAILNGLPPHIAQVIAGHQDISVTIGYKAVYPEETIRSHLAFLARRRALRPSEEYRTPTEVIWGRRAGS